MNLKIKQDQVTKKESGEGWEFEATGRPNWVKRMIRKYVPEIQKLAEHLRSHGNSDQS